MRSPYIAAAKNTTKNIKQAIKMLRTTNVLREKRGAKLVHPAKSNLTQSEKAHAPMFFALRASECPWRF
jgi:hypothetical protein